MKMPVTPSDYWRGAPNGHKGATRPTPEPDEIVEVTAEHCELCDSTDLKNKGVEKRIIEEIPPPPKIKVIQIPSISLLALRMLSSV